MSKFRLVKPRIERNGKNLIKVVWVEHLSKDGSWMEWASVEVRIRRKDDFLEKENKVEINWSAVGAVDTNEAEFFTKGLIRAIKVAKREERKLNVQNI